MFQRIFLNSIAQNDTQHSLKFVDFSDLSYIKSQTNTLSTASIASLQQNTVNAAYSLYGIEKGRRRTVKSVKSICNDRSFFLHTFQTSVTVVMATIASVHLTTAAAAATEWSTIHSWSSCHHRHGVGCSESNRFVCNEYRDDNCSEIINTADPMNDLNTALEAMECVEIFTHGMSNQTIRKLLFASQTYVPRMDRILITRSSDDHKSVETEAKTNRSPLILVFISVTLTMMAAGRVIQKQLGEPDPQGTEQGRDQSLPLRYTNSILDNSDDSVELQEVTIVSLVEQLPKDSQQHNHSTIQFRLKEELRRKSVRFWNKWKRCRQSKADPQTLSVEVIVDDGEESKCPTTAGGSLNKYSANSNRQSSGPQKCEGREQLEFPPFHNCWSVQKLFSNVVPSVEWFFHGYPHKTRKKRKKRRIDRETMDSNMEEILAASIDEHSFRSERQGTSLDEETITVRDKQNRWDDDYSSQDSIPETVQLIFGNTVDEVTSRLLDSAFFETQEWLLVEGQLSQLAEYLVSEAGANFESFVVSLNGQDSAKNELFGTNDVVSDSDSSCTASLLNNIDGKNGMNSTQQCSRQQDRFEKLKKLKYLVFPSTHAKKQVSVNSPVMDARLLQLNKFQMEHLRKLKKLKEQIQNSTYKASSENDVHAKTMQRLCNSIQMEQLRKLREVKEQIRVCSATSLHKNQKAKTVLNAKAESPKPSDLFFPEMSKHLMTICMKTDNKTKHDVSFYCSKPISINEQQRALPQVSLGTQSTVGTVESLSSHGKVHDEKMDNVTILACPKLVFSKAGSAVSSAGLPAERNFDFTLSIPFYPSEAGSAACAEQPTNITLASMDLYGVLSACSDRAGCVDVAMKQLLSCKFAESFSLIAKNNKDEDEPLAGVPCTCARAVDNKLSLNEMTIEDGRLQMATASESVHSRDKLEISVGSRGSLREAPDFDAIKPEMTGTCSQEKGGYLADNPCGLEVPYKTSAPMDMFSWKANSELAKNLRMNLYALSIPGVGSTVKSDSRKVDPIGYTNLKSDSLNPAIDENLEEVEVHGQLCSAVETRHNAPRTHTSPSCSVSVPKYISTSSLQHHHAVNAMTSEQPDEELRDSKEVDVWLHRVHCLRK